MKKILCYLLCTVIATHNIYGQSLALNTSGSVADPSSILDVTSTNKGMLVPRMTMIERDAIVSPANSLLIFQTNNDSGFYYFNSPSATWIKLGKSTTNSCLSIIPRPAYQNYGSNYSTSTSNTNAYLGEVDIPLQITANKIFVGSAGVNIPGKVKISLYSEDGQTQLFEVTTDTITTGGIINVNLVSPININPGLYYISFLPLDGADVRLYLYYNTDIPTSFIHPPGKNVLVGTLVVPANSLPLSFDPRTIVFGDNKCLIFGLEN